MFDINLSVSCVWYPGGLEESFEMFLECRVMHNFYFVELWYLLGEFQVRGSLIWKLLGKPLLNGRLN